MYRRYAKHFTQILLFFHDDIEGLSLRLAAPRLHGLEELSCVTPKPLGSGLASPVTFYEGPKASFSPKIIILTSFLSAANIFSQICHLS